MKAVVRKRMPDRRKPSSPRKGKTRKRPFVFPRWGYHVLSAFLGLLLMAGFYCFFIRPYAYRWKPCYGCREYGVCMPSGYEVHGLDISHHQGEIDWRMLGQFQSGRYPLRFVFIKATEGGDLADNRFDDNFRLAGEHGYIRGAYHFFNPSTPPLRQADFFIRTVRLEKGDLPPVLDVERKGNKSGEELRQAVRMWMEAVERHYGVRPILYTSYKFKMRYLNDSVCNTYPYWIAHYYVDSVRYEGDWKFWQHTDAGVVPGISKEVDLDIFHGSLEELEAMTIR